MSKNHNSSLLTYVLNNLPYVKSTIFIFQSKGHKDQNE